MDYLTNREQQHLDFLRADFTSLKAEIARRSNLQRIAFAVFIAVVAYIGKQVESNQVTAPLLLGLWFASALTLQFYAREDLEIRRLGHIINERIAPIVEKILTLQRRDVLQSETNNKYPEIDKITNRYDIQFLWILFLLAPTAITIFYLSQDWSRLQKLTHLDQVKY